MSRGIYLRKHPEIVANIKLRSKITSAIRRFLDSQGLIEVETPILCTHRDGGPFIQLETVDPANGEKYFLSMCPEDRLKRICDLFEHGVYEFARCFRPEIEDGWHLGEFTMLEVKQPNASMEDQIRLASGLIQDCVLAATEKLQIDDIDFSRYIVTTCDDAVKNATGVSFFDTNAQLKFLKLLEFKGVVIKDKTSRWEVFDNTVKYFVEPTLQSFTFLIDFPLELSTISRAQLGSRTARRFQVVAKGVEIGDGGEKIIGSEGYESLYKANAIYRRNVLGITEKNEICTDFIMDMAEATPIAGFGIGIDRLAALISESKIDDVILFPKQYDC